MPDWFVLLLISIGLLAVLYRAFLHTPQPPPSGNNHEDGATNYWDARGRVIPPDLDKHT